MAVVGTAVILNKMLLVNMFKEKAVLWISIAAKTAFFNFYFMNKLEFNGSICCQY